MIRYCIYFFIIPALLCACGTNEAESDVAAEDGFTYNRIPAIAQMEEAHKAREYYEKDAVSFNISLAFGGKERLSGVYTIVPGTGKVKLMTDSALLVYDGSEVYLSPADAGYPQARFDIFTWQYFFEAPYKFSDAGTNWEELGSKPLFDKRYPTFKLTFDAGIGDAHEDWYIVYKDYERRLVNAMAYIVTFSKSPEEAEEEPHAITYHDYRPVEGIPIAHQWKFWMWSDSAGVYDQLGEASITNVKFIKTDERTFAIPADHTTVPYREK